MQEPIYVQSVHFVSVPRSDSGCYVRSLAIPQVVLCAMFTPSTWVWPSIPGRGSGETHAPVVLARQGLQKSRRLSFRDSKGIIRPAMSEGGLLHRQWVYQPRASRCTCNLDANRPKTQDRRPQKGSLGSKATKGFLCKVLVSCLGDHTAPSTKSFLGRLNCPYGVTQLRGRATRPPTDYVKANANNSLHRASASDARGRLKVQHDLAVSPRMQLLQSQ
jgi:hypothetical protein